MSAWVISQYGTNEVLKYTEDMASPAVSCPDELLVKVHAASLNPLDVSMRGGYGAKLLKLRRDPMSAMDADGEFPVILGRDVSGVVLDCGSAVTHFAPGDEVWAAVPPWKQGSLAEFVTLSEYEVSHKPKLLTHAEAASVPYVASTSLSALVNAGGLCRDSSSNKRVLIIGGSGGVGTFSIQLLKAWGAHVTVTCSQNAEALVRGLGADEVVDHAAGGEAQQLEAMGKFDVVLDGVGGDTEEWALGVLKPWSGAKYATLVTPFLFNTDSMGLLQGTLRAGRTLQCKAVQNMMANGLFYRVMQQVIFHPVGDGPDGKPSKPPASLRWWQRLKKCKSSPADTPAPTSEGTKRRWWRRRTKPPPADTLVEAAETPVEAADTPAEAAETPGTKPELNAATRTSQRWWWWERKRDREQRRRRPKRPPAETPAEAAETPAPILEGTKPELTPAPPRRRRRRSKRPPAETLAELPETQAEPAETPAEAAETPAEAAETPAPILEILPVVEAQFPFSQVPQAFQKLEAGHARGKMVVRVAAELVALEEEAAHHTAEQK
ncbi:reticulon-4-interacting protein 1 homolog, mitochondrial-like [Brachionichthys hirsutus]|uniref:reticulon-4-interacting protein 1 homolog, mitochondrial-like n=1 Tax=Brachionichthys hirsutus TaxID=412623 RepID=UPI0036050851